MIRFIFHLILCYFFLLLLFVIFRPIPKYSHRLQSFQYSPRSQWITPSYEIFLKRCILMNKYFWQHIIYIQGFSGGTSCNETTCQCRSHKRTGFVPWVGNIPWKRAWQSTPVFLPGESHGLRTLAGYSPQGHKESNMTEVNQHTCTQYIFMNSLE